MQKTKIEWYNSTWNPVTGCLHECQYCYARRIASRFGGHWDDRLSRTVGANREIHELDAPLLRHTNGKNRDISVHNVSAPLPFCFDPTFHRYRLHQPQRQKPQTIFVCSMADLFGEWIPDKWIEDVFAACEKAPQHRYLFLTKNPQRYTDLARAGKLPAKDNMWYGTTVTTPDEQFFCGGAWHRE